MRKLLVAALIAASAGTAAAQVYPSRPVTLVVPYPAGGPTDTLTRVLAERMRASLGQAVVVENVSGAGGAVGVGRVARAAPDGHMGVVGHWQTHVVNAATQTLPYDVVKDFEPVSLLADCPMWIVARNGFPAKDFKEMVDWLKANPGKATVGIVGVGGGADVVATYFQKNTGTTVQFVPYRGGAPMTQDLVAGQIDMTFTQVASSLQQARGGQIKAYVVMAKGRWWAAPDIPTIDEAGVPGLYASFWHGLWAPRMVPKEILAKLNGAVRDALADPAVQQRFRDVGQEIATVDLQTPDALAAQQKAEIEKWW